MDTSGEVHFQETQDKVTRDTFVDLRCFVTRCLWIPGTQPIKKHALASYFRVHRAVAPYLGCHSCLHRAMVHAHSESRVIRILQWHRHIVAATCWLCAKLRNHCSEGHMCTVAPLSSSPLTSRGMFSLLSLFRRFERGCLSFSACQELIARLIQTITSKCHSMLSNCLCCCISVHVRDLKVIAIKF